MNLNGVDELRKKMNFLGKNQKPFLFIFDFEMKEPILVTLDELDHSLIKYAFNDDFLNLRNFETSSVSSLPQLEIKKNPIAFSQYEKAYNYVLQNLNAGNSFLTNLTAETPIEINWDLDSLFQNSFAKYKLFIRDKLLCFSPEAFIRINASGKISSFPMKGTINANLPNAEKMIMADKKEKFEHTTIVDLIRNDLSRVARKVWVERFRFIDRIRKQDGSELLQISSEVCAHLSKNWKERIGDVFLNLLPAGSISGAPKPSTLAIIKKAEKKTYPNGKRGFYSGVFGVFDGEKLNSAVMIRYIEQTKNGLVFKSGGGLTSRSNAYKEYEELISKIYAPVF